MLLNTVGEVRELAYVKQIGDQDVARGRNPLDYETYMELLLSACSVYDKKVVLPGKSKRAVYASMIDADDVDVREHDDGNDNAYAMYNVDTDVSEIMVNAGMQKSSFLPRDEWNKLSDEEKERLIAKRRQERLNSASGTRKSYPPRQANVHDIGDVINLDDIVDYTVMKHDVVSSGEEDDKVKSDDDDALLAYMAGRTSSLGDIRQVLAAKSTPDKKNKNRKVNASESVPDIVQVGDTTYYLNKGETINVQGHQYSTHMTNVNYRVGQHDVAMMEKALIDRGANGGICGDDMLVLEGSERFVDVVGLAGHKVSQLRIVTSQELVKG
jgi:hypothetical protein